MEFEVEKEYSFFGRVDNINISEDRSFGNINVTLQDKKQINIKLKEEFFDEFKNNKVFWFHILVHQNEIRDRIDYILLDTKIIYDYYKEDMNELSIQLTHFYEYAPVDMEHIKSHIENVLDGISNKVVKDIANAMYQKYKDRFYIYPAATKFHHAYIGGLAYHTNSMLELAELLCSYYSYLNKDYVYSGVILHDILKVVEFSDAEGPEYTSRGILLGHIYMSAAEIHSTALELGYVDTEEEMVMTHIVLAHHGQPNFGSPKKPMIAEAFIVATIDNLDSKMVVLGEALDKTPKGDFTEPINVLDKLKFYKPTNE